MEPPAVREVVQALQAIGVKFQGEHGYKACQSCNRIRRWPIGEIAHKRVMNLVLCNACLSLAHIATTNKSEIIVT